MLADRPDLWPCRRRADALAAAVLRRRTLLTMLLGAVLTVTSATYRQRGEGGLRPFRYEELRRQWRHCADGVIGGDSRVQRGVCPSVMSPPLGARRLVNLAYPHAALTPAYLARLAETLDPRSTRRLIVLGVTPASLTPAACRLSEFARSARSSGLHGGRRLVEWLFQPYGLDGLWRLLTAQSPQGASYFSPDGWRGAVTNMFAPKQEATRLRDRREAGAVEPLDPGLVGALFEQVSRWNAEGIHVYGFRPPTNSATVAIENAAYGFEEATFVAGFESAGGVWIDLPADAYATYDGSHLDGAAAVELSAHLGLRIALEEATWPTVCPAGRKDEPAQRAEVQATPNQADNF